ncbi:MAG: rhodanese-like domain-containing protein [Flavobacteriaceae bacterium]|nr:rhodanese-like domain-containing protein [Bacteroidia bacterium]MBT8287935.1 rhodanese-like domain-containing protein [Bacteroidia bacterium]NNF74418.1 rhodanese-like domain-containing protein [Flavobacteriaceae bacterium]NNK73619.1 rhodanese-like domain-containing protein [Flavobacteriaceae bacterium]
MKKQILFILIVLFVLPVCGQRSLNRVIEKHNDGSVPYISVEDLNKLSDVILFDTREKREFDVSHIKNAVFVGYETFDINAVIRHHPEKNKTIVVYCSIGIRSEDIGKKLLSAGYTNVFNLYGGLFNWFEQDLPLYENSNEQTNRIHGFTPYWGKWLNKGQKIYD